MGAGKSGFISSSGAKGEHSSWLADPHSKVHVGIGCDSCGVNFLALLFLMRMPILFFYQYEPMSINCHEASFVCHTSFG